MDREELCGRVVRPPQDEPEDAADEARQGAEFEQHVLVEDAAADRLECHPQEVPGQPEHHEDAETADDPCDRRLDNAQRLRPQHERRYC